VAAAGFDHSVAVASCAEARPKSDVKRGGSREREGRGFEEAGIHEGGQKPKVERPKKIEIRINEDGDDALFEGRVDSIFVDEAGGNVFDSGLTLVNGLRKRDEPPHCERTRQFSDDDAKARVMQSERDAAGEVAAAAQEDESVHDLGAGSWSRCPKA
jgi:hypothetical protein